MNKLQVRCKKVYISTPEFTNIPIYILLNGGWSNYKSFVCIECGKIVIGNLENPLLRMATKDFVADLRCSNCNANFKESLRDYPETIILPNGHEYHCLSEGFINPDDSDIFEFDQLG